MGKYLGSRTLLMFVHIVNIEDVEEHVINEFSSLSMQINQPSITMKLIFDYDTEASKQIHIKLGTYNDFFFTT